MFTIINEPQMVFKLLRDMLWINKKNLTASASVVKKCINEYL